MKEIFEEVVVERQRQDIKWGIQNHPSIDQTLLNREGGCSEERMCEEYEIPSQTRAKFLCDNATKNGELTWTHIALEELSEVVCAKDDNERRTELIQLKSVILAWIQCIDRNNNNK